MKKIILVLFCTIFISSYSILDPCYRLCLINGFRVSGNDRNESELIEIKDIVKVLNSRLKENQKIQIQGHTDSSEVIFKKRLSLERAKNIYILMRAYGFREDIEVEFIGMGGKEPRYNNTTPEGRFQNRRVEILFLINKDNEYIKY